MSTATAIGPSAWRISNLVDEYSRNHSAFWGICLAVYALASVGLVVGVAAGATGLPLLFVVFQGLAMCLVSRRALAVVRALMGASWVRLSRPTPRSAWMAWYRRNLQQTLLVWVAICAPMLLAALLQDQLGTARVLLACLAYPSALAAGLVGLRIGQEADASGAWRACALLGIVALVVAIGLDVASALMQVGYITPLPVLALALPTLPLTLLLLDRRLSQDRAFADRS